ncbi:MAG: delta-class carbonic anhydrase [Kiloniellales bacterium]|nr:delta-class carbonic anhydrase [Kiloniellales bacterium]
METTGPRYARFAPTATFPAAAFFCTPSPVASQDLCVGYGPQTPRDISSPAGANTRLFTFAPAASRMNLCNLHTHTNAEHKGPGFAISAGSGKYGGWKCNETGDLTEAELAVPDGDAAYEGVKPGDTIEVHWVYSSCDVTPGKGLGSCLSDACANPQLRVEAQVFLVVNDPNALDFGDFAYAGNVVGGLHQAKSLPTGAGDPVTFLGSTTGPSFTQSKCSPLQVTWSVRPACAKLDINSLHRWAANGNVFEEEHSHGVRQLDTAPELLAPMN